MEICECYHCAFPTKGVLRVRLTLRSFFRFTTNAHVSRLSMAVGWTFILLSLVVTVSRNTRLAVESARDFANIYAGSKCLVTRCSPYDPASLEVVLEREGYSSSAQSWADTLPIYPPPTLLLALPLAILPLGVASGVMYLLTLLCLVGAEFLVYVRSEWLAEVSPALRGLLFGLTLHAPKVSFALVAGNPGLLSFALLTWCGFDITEARWRRAVLFSIACILKPPLALPMVLVLAMKPQDGWTTVRRAGILLASFTAVSLVWFHVRFGTISWWNGLRGNLALGRALSMSPNDHTTVQTNLLNVEYLIGYWVPQAWLRLCLTAVLLLLLGGALLAGLRRIRPYVAQRELSPRLLMLVTGCVAAFTLLPVYHRFYDAILLLLVLPWTVTALQRREAVPAATASLLLVAATYFTWARHLPERIRGVEGLAEPSSLLGFLTHRADAIETLALCVVLTTTLLYEGRRLERMTLR